MKHISRGLAVAAAAAAVIAAGMATTGAAHAATPASLHVTLGASSDGASATWNADGNPVLTTGSVSSSTYAEVGLSVAGQPVPPSTSPSFTTDHYASGSPRMVVELNNGKTLVGYPGVSGLNGSDMAWAVGNSGTYTDYATAYAAVNAHTTTVKDAFIVADGDQAAGAKDTVSGIQFGGATVQVARSNTVVVKNRHSGKCLNEGPDGLSQYACNVAGIYKSLTWQVETFADGSRYLVSEATGGFARSSSTQGAQLTLSPDPSPVALGNGGFFRFGSLYMDVQGMSRVNAAHVIGWTYNGQANQRWDFANAPS